MEYNKLNILRANTKIENFDEQYNESILRIDELFKKHNDCTPILIAVTGSTSYGLDLEKSDIDFKGVYIQNLDSLLSELKLGQSNPLIYKNQIEDDNNDIVFYEISRLMELLQNNNPNSLELLSTPTDCILYKHPIWDEIIDELNKCKILTKNSYYTFHNYASQQIKKATGLNKKINNPIDKERKTPIDFCHVLFENDSAMYLRPYLEREQLDQRLCGLVNIPHAKGLYSMYYDTESAKSFSKYEDQKLRDDYRLNKRSTGEVMGFGYKGIIKENESNEEVSNEIRTSSVPKGEKRIALLSYNKDGYMTYCKDYNAFWGKDGWMNKRNEERYNDNISSGQNYDGKNLSHCLRLLYMAREIADGKGIIVRRNEQQRNELLEIKKGRWSYEDIMKKCEELTFGLEDDFKKSDLPDNISNEVLMKLICDIRLKVYNIKK